MDLKEYYKFPEGSNVTQSFLPHWLCDKPNYPCPSVMSYAFSQYKGTYIPPLDVSNVTTMSYMFDYCQKITSLDLSNWNTSKVTHMSNMFNFCQNLTSLDLSSWDTSNVIDMEAMFKYCNSLTSVDLSNWDTSKVTKMSNMFANCAKLTSLDISKFNLENCTSIYNLISGADKLETLSSIDARNLSGSNGASFCGFSANNTLKNFGGLIGLKVSVTSNYGINKLPNLTYESCINVLNGLYDFTGNGETPTSSQGQLKVHSNFLTLVGDEISIGVNKGWTITA